MSAGRSPITTHVLDTSLGRPAAGVAIELYRIAADGGARLLGRGETDADGRLAGLLPARPIEAGRYRLDFAVGAYFAASGRASLYPAVSILFEVAEPAAHYHIPLLISPFGYSTYRGS
jgi:5-hydroxyisourate hydrolase